MAVVLVSLILVFFVFQLIGPPLVSVVQTSNTIIQESLASSGDGNLTAAGEASFQPAADSLNNFEWISYTIFIVLILTWLIMCFYVRTYPFLMVIWILLVIVLVALSLYLSVVYQDLRLDPTLGTYYQSWENTDYFLQFLPAIVVIVGIIGGIIMFAILSRDNEAELGYYPV